MQRDDKNERDGPANHDGSKPHKKVKQEIPE